MDITRVIIGPVVTEKAEREKTVRTHAMRVHPDASKVDVQNALKKMYDVEVDSIRMMHVRGKSRALGAGKMLQKRRPYKKAIVTLAKGISSLDLAKFASRS